MGRRIVAGAALAALMVVLPACAMHSTFSSSQPTGTPVTYHHEVEGPHHEAVAMHHEDGMHHDGHARHCERYVDCTACYHSEADRDMGRLDDDLPPGGCCKRCGD